MALTNFPNGISSFGIPVLGSGGIPATKGNVYFVDYGSGSDGYNGKSPSRAFKTLDKANTVVTSNNDDVICLIGNTTHTLTEMLTVSKNRVHFIGLDGTYRSYGQNAKISIGATGVATDIAAVKVTGVRCSFQNIKFMSSNTVAQGLYTVIDGGEYTVFDSCELYLSSQLTATGAAELACNGDSSQFRNCVFGSSAIVLVGAIVRPCVILTKALIAGKVSRDVTFTNCEFWRKATNSANAFVWATTATDVERKMEFRDCLFYADKTSTATPAVAVGGAAALTDGRIVLTGTTAEVGCTALATQTGIWSALPTLAAAGGSALQAT